MVATPVDHVPMVKRAMQAAKAARANWVLSRATTRPATYLRKPHHLRMTAAPLQPHAMKTGSSPVRSEIGTVMVASAARGASAKSVLICASRRNRSVCRPTKKAKRLRALLPCRHRHHAWPYRL